MILSLALAQHSRLVHGALEAQGNTEFGVGEALLKQHVAALELVGQGLEALRRDVDSV